MPPLREGDMNKMKYEASIREIENGFVTKDNFDGEYSWNNAKDAFAHIQECLEKMAEFNKP